VLINLPVKETANARSYLFRGFEVNGKAKPFLNPDSNWYVLVYVSLTTRARVTLHKTMMKNLTSRLEIRINYYQRGSGSRNREILNVFRGTDTMASASLSVSEIHHMA
jgi:hypothetical protein